MADGRGDKIVEKNRGRREFLQLSATAAVLANLPLASRAFAAGDEVIKVGLIGCGGRGTGAAANALEADPRVRVVALADVFSDRVEGAKNELAKRGERFTATPETCYVGFDAFEKLLQNDLTYVILATPPHFRPQHLKAAIDKGIHVFTEKPVCVDPVGGKLVLETGEQAKQKGLSIVAGTQRRHEKVYHDVYKQILDGAIGDIVSARCYWNMGQLWHRNQESSWSPMEWMIRDWVNWCWLSGDHIVEQHVHNIDVVNWFTTQDGSSNKPVRAVGMGGRAHRPTGDQYDYFSVDFEYPNGLHVASYCRQVNGCDNNVSETIVGTKGQTFTQSGYGEIRGESKTRFGGRGYNNPNPYVQEHVDLIQAITSGNPVNEASNVAISTLTAVLGRLAAYGGKPITWDEMMKSDLRIGPEQYSWDIPLPEIRIPVAGRA